uniref:Peroxisome assembly protein 12 n=1 Tax=Eptatretus burgeri TaxID=7764 RepID=A0A8C4QJD5_EPTBU
VLVESNPSRWEFLWSWFDELYSLLELTLQHHYLISTGASFSENFYGLKRVPQFPRSTEGWLPLREHRVSLFLLVAGPYLRVKLTKLFQRLRDERDFGVVFPHTVRARLQQLFLSTYPLAVLAWEGIGLYFQLCYALGKVKRHSILLWFAGVYLSHRTPQDTARLPKQLQEAENFSNEAGLIGRIASILKSVFGGTTMSISSAFSILVFFLQFLEYWYAAGARESMAADPFGPWCPIPPAPTHLEVHGESTEKCPICLQPRSNPAVLSTSGVQRGLNSGPEDPKLPPEPRSQHQTSTRPTAGRHPVDLPRVPPHRRWCTPVFGQPEQHVQSLLCCPH